MVLVDHVGWGGSIRGSISGAGILLDPAPSSGSTGRSASLKPWRNSMAMFMSGWNDAGKGAFNCRVERYLVAFSPSDVFSKWVWDSDSP